MWRFVSGGDSGDHPHLTSLNGFQGRQTWEYDEGAGTPEQVRLRTCSMLVLCDARLARPLRMRTGTGGLGRAEPVRAQRPAQRAAVDAARAAFAASRDARKHSADELLRLQCVHRAAPRPPPPPARSDAPTHDGLAGALRSALGFYEQLQCADGHWPGDYGGPMFLMPGLVIACYVTGVLNTVLSAAHQAEMVRYLRNHQNGDGGYGGKFEPAMKGFARAQSPLELHPAHVRPGYARRASPGRLSDCSCSLSDTLTPPGHPTPCESRRAWRASIA